MSAPLLVSDRPRPRITKQPLSVGCLIYEQMDQIDFTGPFEVLSRMPDTTIRIIGKELAPVRDVQGLRLIPDGGIAQREYLMCCSCLSAVSTKLMPKSNTLWMIRIHSS